MTDLDGTEMIPILDESEIASIASEMARAYAGMVRYYREAYGLTVEEAERKTRELIESAKGDDRALTGPSDQVSWYQLMELMEHEPKKAVAAWERVKHAAREELASGLRASTAVHGVHGSPWDRARLLAIREAFRKEWRPSNGIEGALIDTLAQAHYAYLFWLERLMGRAIGQVELDEGDLGWEGRWRPPLLAEAEATHQAAGMVDRFNRLFMRTLRGLRDLRRYATKVTIQRAQQVNIGEQQVNVAGDVKESETGPKRGADVLRET